jgi:hypothetical protein
MKDVKKDMARYCRQEIWDYDLKCEIALGYIDRMRCPLSMAGINLFDEMQEKIEEYCEDNNLNPDDFDVEEIFWIEPNE